jgi:hypothetical protein
MRVAFVCVVLSELLVASGHVAYFGRCLLACERSLYCAACYSHARIRAIGACARNLHCTPINGFNVMQLCITGSAVWSINRQISPMKFNVSSSESARVFIAAPHLNGLGIP